MQITQSLTRAAKIRGTGEATVFGDRIQTWAEVRDRTSRLAMGLRGLGLQSGDFVAILAQNCDRYFEFVYGTLWAGGAIAPMNTRHSKAEMMHCLVDCDAKILLTDSHHAAMAQELRAEIPGLDHIVCMVGSGEFADVIDYEQLIATNDPAEDARRSFDDIAGVFYTSGTTGRSKGVLLTHMNLLSNCCNGYAERYAEEGSSILHTAPLFHLSGMANMLAVTLRAGQQIFLEKFVPHLVLAAIETYRPKSIVLAPTMLQMLLDDNAFGKFDLTSLEQIMYGSAPMPEPLLKRALKLMPDGIGFRQGYGMTETAAGGTILGPQWHNLEGEHVERLKSAGRPAMLCEVIVVDENDNEVGTREIGEVLIRGPVVMKGYLNLPELSAEVLRGGWMHTGDIGFQDEDGFIFIVDRKKDMIITGGENVYSSEVENAICEIPGVQQCAVIGIPHEKWGEAVHAIISCSASSGLTEALIQSQLESTLSRYKRPRSIDIVFETLPTTPSGKIQKNVLRMPFWKGRGSQLA